MVVSTRGAVSVLFEGRRTGMGFEGYLRRHDAIHGLASAGTRRNSPISADRLVVAELYIWPINGAPNPIWGAL